MRGHSSRYAPDEPDTDPLDRALDEARTTWASAPRSAASARPATARRAPKEAATTFARPAAARVLPQEAQTSYWSGRDAEPARSPRAATYLSAARGGSGRPSAVVASAPMTLGPEPRAARPSYRAPSQRARSGEIDRGRPRAAAPRVPTEAASSYQPASHEPASTYEPASRSVAAVAPRGARPAAPSPEPASRSVGVEGPSAVEGSAPSRLPSQPQSAGPLRIDAPPDVALAAYPLVRRVALQQDLKTADRVLRVGLAELANATTCRTWFVGADQELFSLELKSDTEAAEQALIDQSIASAQPRASGRLLTVPVVAAGRVISVALLARTEQQPSFAPADLMVAMVVVQETSGFLVQLLIHHAEAQRDLAADAKSIYNPEALASQRSRGQEGGLIHLSPRWVRLAYPTAVLCVVIAIIFAVIAHVPIYSAGAGVITIEGLEITAPSPGTVAAVQVQSGQPVRAGQELARLLAQDEESALAQADREYRNALATLLFDGADENTKAAVAAAAATRQRAMDRLEARVIRAPEDGVVGDIRVRSGAALGIGDHVLTLLRKDAEPTVLVFLPGQDRPRLRRGQTIQIELSGYTKVRERGTIVEVGAEVIGPNEARRALGQKNADAVPLAGPVVMVRAKLPTRTFRVNRDVFHYHDGMPLRGEVKVENKPFLISLIPALEKAL
ncbi:MAG: HlyD family efflux transporter periplasmic adaptor subunit [Kofleriaceae bacterium]